MVSTEPCPSLPEGFQELVALFRGNGVAAVTAVRLIAEKIRDVKYSSTRENIL